MSQGDVEGAGRPVDSVAWPRTVPYFHCPKLQTRPLCPVYMAHFSEYPGSTTCRGHMHLWSKVLPCDLEGRKALIVVYTQVLSSLSDSKSNEGLEESDQGACRRWHLARQESQHSLTSIYHLNTLHFLSHSKLALQVPPSSHYSPYQTWLISHICPRVTPHLLRTPAPANDLPLSPNSSHQPRYLDYPQGHPNPVTFGSSVSLSSMTLVSPPQPPTYCLECLL